MLLISHFRHFKVLFKEKPYLQNFILKTKAIYLLVSISIYDLLTKVNLSLFKML